MALSFTQNSSRAGQRFLSVVVGPRGPSGTDPGAIRFDETQSLTDEQKERARGNVGIWTYATRSTAIAANIPSSATIVELQDYATAGDGGGGRYAKAESEPSHGCKFQSGDGAWWELIYDGYGVPAERAGVFAGGSSAANTAGLQALIDFLPTLGGTIFLPPGIIAIEEFTIGDGDSENHSSKSGVQIIGAGSGFIFGTRGTILNYFGSDNGTVITINGPIENILLSGFSVTGRNVADVCIDAKALRFSELKNLYITGFLDTGLKTYATDHPTGRCIMNSFEGIYIANALDDVIGWDIDGVFSVVNDMWLSVVKRCRIDVQGANAKGLRLGFSDNMQWDMIHIAAIGAGGVSICFDAMTSSFGGNSYPLGHIFIGGSFLGEMEVLEDETHTIGVNYFLSYGVTDNEPLPTHSKLRGITRDGISFNSGISGVKKLTSPSATEADGQAAHNITDGSNGGLQTVLYANAQVGIGSVYTSTAHPMYIGAGDNPTNGIRVNTDGTTRHFENARFDKGVDLHGASSGVVSVKTQDAAGTYNWNLPTTAGSAGNILASGGGGSDPMTWKGVTGTGNVALADSPTFTTKIFTPVVQLTSGANLSHVYQSDAAMMFNNVANGAINWYRAGVLQWTVTTGTHLHPGTDNSSDIGSNTARVRTGYFGNVVVTPGASVTPANNGEVTFQLTSNTSLTFMVKGSDGTVRSGSIALS